VTLDSPALWVMTDLTQVSAATVRPDETLGKAEALMIQEGVRMLFVVAHMPCVEGIVTATSLTGDKPMKLVQQRKARRHELFVADVMTRLSDLDAVPLETLERSTVGAVAATLRKFGRPHLLVVERATSHSAARIRGLISHTQVERQLGSPLPIHEIATTFVEIEQALA
jgi:CBS domain-containing protein